MYVGVDEASALAAGTTIAGLVDAVRNVVTDAVPGTESHAAVAYAPATQRGKNLDIVRLFVRRGKIKFGPPKSQARIDFELREFYAAEKKSKRRKEK